MKKIVFLLFVTLLALSQANAEEKKEKTYKELVAEFMELDAKLSEEKKKTESIKEVGRKLDELLGVLPKEK